ncbi:FAD binding domain-containing protein [Clostridium sp. UBA1652]|uniref:FAD binding domain-containing protein n=1 Tax=Clostridium sp. UBA1652 TaxID=1946348 RepID=UPI00257EA30C|nr:FAD binding domain-containing protein [Clostridium sp. UBA1652]
MISYNFEYHKPKSLNEAISLFQDLDKNKKSPIYFSGGTEIITLGRVNKINTGAVIDIKEIPDCLLLRKDKGIITLGASQTLNKIKESQYFPFLGKSIVEIADHTARNKITLGGNICSNIKYRETILPLLLTDSKVLIAGPKGLKLSPIENVFNKNLNLDRGELLAQIVIEEKELESLSLCIKKRKHWDVGYPLVTVSANKKDNFIRFAFSGLCAYPFRSKEMEENLNDRYLSQDEKIEKAINNIPDTVLNDVHGSDGYRKFVLKNTLIDILRSVENE